MKYRKKPIVIEAIQWTGNNQEAITMFMRPSVPPLRKGGDMLWINTLEGTMTAQPGDWIIRGVAGELYPCRDDIFRATYEEVEA